MRNNTVVAILGFAVLFGGAPALADGTGRIYVSNEKSNTISILDIETETVVGEFKTCARPRGMHFNLDRTQFFVGCADDDVIAVYEVATGELLRRMYLISW